MLFLASLFCWTLLVNENLWLLSLLIFSLLLMGLYERRLSVYINSLKLLSWFFLPVILFQGLFTPGTYIQFPFYIPLSIEGLLYAMTLCLHIGTLFVVALLFSRLISLPEWHYALSKSPRLNQLLKPYLLLMQPMRGYISELFRHHYGQWKIKGRKLRQIPSLLVRLLEQVIGNAKKEANTLWQEWDNHFEQNEKTLQPDYRISDYLYGLYLFLGWGLFWP